MKQAKDNQKIDPDRHNFNFLFLIQLDFIQIQRRHSTVVFAMSIPAMHNWISTNLTTSDDYYRHLLQTIIIISIIIIKIIKIIKKIKIKKKKSKAKDNKKCTLPCKIQFSNYNNYYHHHHQKYFFFLIQLDF